ncbi:MAG: orotidine 5'-phosphate decarboxylase [Betaproteobacteria bacterium RIFCSPLOWO2_02_FULL_62_17]|nr:MAG: orotidine 5'-phosphate decarboxylase [Betaproteobacteria bacterium RIFCSPLOWO2_02_FULL_62_17]
MSDFATRLAQRMNRYGPLCAGIDPSAATLAKCGLPDSAEGALEFGKLILRSADYELAVIKPQSAFFERFGSAGMKAIEELAALARAKEVPLLLDVKRGDIDSTADAYAHAYFHPSSPIRVDAITLSPYLGVAALKSSFELAAKHACGIFVVVRSSNPEGEALQTARMADGRRVWEALCAAISDFNRALSAGPIGPIGAVVGATCTDAGAVVAALPRSFILSPGIGAQGATMEDCRVRLAPARGRILPNVSRELIAGGSSAAAIGATIRRLNSEARGLLA